MAKMTIIFLDGYKGWNVSRTKTKEYMGTFDEETCQKALCSVEGISGEEASMSLKDLVGQPVKKNNVITCMGEESGVVFVGE